MEFANSSSITLNTDPAFTNMDEAQKLAQEHCDRYGKDAVPQMSADSACGLRSPSFRCEKRQD